MLKKILLFKTILIVQILFAQTVTTVTDGNFHDGLAVDSQGNVYGSDFPPVPPFPNPVKNVYKYDTDGDVTVFATGFVSPNGIGINSQDEIYVCDHYRNNIKKFSSNGTLLMTTSIGQFTTPSGIKPIPNSLDMLVVEYNTGKLKQLSSNGEVTTLHDGSPLFGPVGITFIEAVPYIANFNDRKIFRFLNGALTEVAQLPSNNNPQTDWLGFLTSANGFLYATHIGSHSIYKIDPTTGVVTLFAGSVQGNQDGDLETAKFDNPNGIVADPSTGNLYVSDAGPGNNPVKNLRIIQNAFLSTNDFSLDTIGLEVFPNPVKENLNIKLKLRTLDSLKIEIFDITGKSVYKNEIMPNDSDLSLSIPISQWSKGTYVFQCLQKDKRVTKKFIL